MTASSTQPEIAPITNKSGRTYWQSFEHLANSPEIDEKLSKEFEGYDPDDIRMAPSRRKFMKFAAASMALAGIGLSGCRRWPEEVIAAHAHDPVDHIPGVPRYYATSWELGGVGNGLLAESFDGRPIKLEGNPTHPGARTRSFDPDRPERGWGATSVYAQGQTLALYDPERSRGFADVTGRNPVRISREQFDARAMTGLREALASGRLAVLAGATASPTLLRLLRQLPAGAWHTWEPAVPDLTARMTGERLGQALRPVYHLDKAKVIVGLDDDYLGTHPASVRYMSDWAKGRASLDDEQKPAMSRTYHADAKYSLTGSNADVREPVRPSELPALAKMILDRVESPGATGGIERLVAFADEAAAALLEHQGEALVAFGMHLPADVQAIALKINQLVGAMGVTLDLIPDPVERGGSIVDLANKMAGGEVDALLVLGGNPVYDAPSDLNFRELLDRVGLSVHLSPYIDETSLAAGYHVPEAHFLECWGDTRGWDGTYAPQQPLIRPLFNGLSPVELLAATLGLETTDGYQLARETFAEVTGTSLQPEIDPQFRRFLHDGVWGDTAAEPIEVRDIDVSDVEVDAPAGGIELTFVPHATIFDGRFANNGWLQECPDPLTKLTWDNAALMNVVDAEEMGVRTGSIVEVRLGERVLPIAVYVMPGQPRGVVTLPLGYGRRAGGSLAVVTDDQGGGFDTYRVRSSDGLWTAAGATIAPTGAEYVLAMTQNHHLIDDTGFKGRIKRTGEKNKDGKIIRETSFEKHKKFVTGEDGQRLHPTKRKYNYGPITLQVFEPPHEYNYPNAWGMTIDMTACTGCSACVVACQGENNIPVVGKDGVLNNREMHWLRVDRYFKSSGEDVDAMKRDPNPDVVYQPMMCVHCENAPCEQVCPVAATVHDTTGLNVMVYNRCIGTRYCSNNCPYKVRRFNYLDYHYKRPRGSTLDAMYLGVPDQQQSEIDVVRQMAFNPDVTVRMRGVMEKCTYCQQRIQKQTIYDKNRSSADGDGAIDNAIENDGAIKTACQQACPTEAIVFGNLNDANARVTRQQMNPRTYGVLDELNTRPRTKYMAKVRNRPVGDASKADYDDATADTAAS